MKANTSITLPKWQKYRIIGCVRKLEEKRIFISKTSLIVLCLNQLNKQQEIKPLRDRARKYNTKQATFFKYSIIWQHEQYNVIHLKAHTMRVSVSSLVDLALDLYLNIIYVRICNEFRNPKVQTLQVDSSIGIYYWICKNITENTFKIKEYFYPPPDFLGIAV